MSIGEFFHSHKTLNRSNKYETHGMCFTQKAANEEQEEDWIVIAGDDHDMS